MKKIHIALLILIAVAVSVTVAVMAGGEGSGLTSWETFASAAKSPNSNVKIIATMVKDRPVVFEPQKDPNHFYFWTKDKNGEVRQIVCDGAPPHGNDMSQVQEIYMTGKMDGSQFHCTSIQMKCPSKYKKDQIPVAANAS